MHCKVLDEKFAFALASLMQPKIKSQGVECLKITVIQRFGAGGCLITPDWRCQQGVVNWENI